MDAVCRSLIVAVVLHVAGSPRAAAGGPPPPRCAGLRLEEAFARGEVAWMEREEGGAAALRSALECFQVASADAAAARARVRDARITDLYVAAERGIGLCHGALREYPQAQVHLQRALAVTHDPALAGELSRDLGSVLLAFAGASSHAPDRCRLAREAAQLLGPDQADATRIREAACTGRAVFDVFPRGVGVLVDGQRIQDVRSPDLDPGRHVASVADECFAGAEVAFVVRGDAEVTVELRAAVRTARLRIVGDAVDAGAAVRVDAERVGVIPFDGDVPACAVAVSVERPGGAWTHDLALRRVAALALALPRSPAPPPPVPPSPPRHPPPPEPSDLLERAPELHLTLGGFDETSVSLGLVLPPFPGRFRLGVAGEICSVAYREVPAGFDPRATCAGVHALGKYQVGAHVAVLASCGVRWTALRCRSGGAAAALCATRTAPDEDGAYTLGAGRVLTARLALEYRWIGVWSLPLILSVQAGATQSRAVERPGLPLRFGERVEPWLSIAVGL